MRRSLFLDSGAADGSAPPAVAAPVAPSAPAPTAIEAAVAAARERIALAPQAPAAPAAAPIAGEGAPIDQSGAALASGAPAGAPDASTDLAAADWSKVDWATFDIPAFEQANPTVFFLPPRDYGQPPIPVILDNPTIVDDLRRLRNDGMRGAEYAEAVRDLDKREGEFTDAMIAMRANPVGFVLNQLDPQDATRVAMSVLVHPSVWQTMVPTLKALIGNEANLELTRARLHNQNTQAEIRAREAVETDRASRQNAEDIRRAIHALTPRNLTRDQQKLWRDHARRTLREYADRNQLVAIDVRDVPSILTQHLAAFNVAPEEAWARMRSAFMGGGTTPTPAAPAPSRATAPNGAPGSGSPDARRAVAAIAPVGAGAAPARMPTPPKGQGVQERLEWFKQNAGTLRRA